MADSKIVKHGTNLSQLTSGELLLIGLLTSDTYMLGRFIIGYKTPIDWSNVYSISVRWISDGPSLIRVDSRSNPSVGTVEVSSSSPNGTINMDPSQVDRTYFTVFDYRGTGSGFAGAQLTSFTTADGKVHTASNLNY